MRRYSRWDGTQLVGRRLVVVLVVVEVELGPPRAEGMRKPYGLAASMGLDLDLDCGLWTGGTALHWKVCTTVQ